MTRDEIIKLASQAIDDTRSAVSLPIPFVMRFAALVAAAERAERTEREKQEPIAWYCDGEDGREYNGCPQMSNGRTGTPLYAAPPVTAPGEQKLGLLSGCVTKSAMVLIDAADQNIGKVTVTTDTNGRAVAVTRTDDDGRILGVIWSAPVTAPVRLTNEQVEHALRTNGAYESDVAYAMAKDGLLTDARAIETAVLRANGFDIQPARGGD